MARDKDINTDNDPVTAVERREKELNGHDLERAREGDDLGEKVGRQSGTSEGVHKVWQSSAVSERVREIAAHVHTNDYARVPRLES